MKKNFYSFLFFSIIKFERLIWEQFPKDTVVVQVILIEENNSLHCSLLYGTWIKCKKQRIQCKLSVLGLTLWADTPNLESKPTSLPIFRKLSFLLTTVPGIQFWAGLPGKGTADSWATDPGKTGQSGVAGHRDTEAAPQPQLKVHTAVRGQRQHQEPESGPEKEPEQDLWL